MGYELIGSGFSKIPANAVGVYANDNNKPLEFSDVETASLLFNIEVLSDTRLKATPGEAASHVKANYLGAILSNDRQEVLWVNETRPLA